VAEVVYIDYGNSEKQAWAKLRPLDPQFNMQRLKAQAVDAQLSFIQLPQTDMYLNDAINFIYELTEGKQLVGSFDYIDTKENMNYITIYDPKGKGAGDANASLNREIVLNGHAMVPRKLKPWEKSKVFEPVLKNLKEAETEAKGARKGVWEYGDIYGDDE
jgi:staphylococcal nuclease domain-containing protein 1